MRFCLETEAALPLAESACAVLCDVHLGVEKGADAARMFRSRGFTRPIILMSADWARQTVTESIAAGINDYLVKPFDRQSLLAKLQRHVPALIPALDPQPARAPGKRRG